MLASFYAIFFADLKKYKYTYHFAFPALHSTPPWKLKANNEEAQTKLEPPESRLLYDAVQTWKYSVDPRQHGFFLAKRDPSTFGPLSSQSKEDEHKSDATNETTPEPPRTPKTPTASSVGFQWTIASISSFESGFFDNTPSEDCFICFADPSTYPANPGWPLRNLLVLVKHRWQLHDIQVLCYRDKHSSREHPNSIVLHLTSPPSEPTSASSESALKSEQMPKVTGWERNEHGKLTSRIIDLSSYMDPTKLADQAVDLNLKLMKWRIAPDLDLSIVSQTKCLLLGAGTLGSYVARNLLGWGVRQITFVDNGKVSFSNPVRQPLFRYDDCVSGGRLKAERAAESLREIYPGVKTEGVVLSVPMAGHPVVGEDGEARVKAEFEKLKELIEEHDVVFLLMDTRESRWLPTVMSKSMGKTVINAALGFDTYVVMRHGSKPSTSILHHTTNPSTSEFPISGRAPRAAVNPSPEEGASLGCYFCNDVVAPADVSPSNAIWHFHTYALCSRSKIRPSTSSVRSLDPASLQSRPPSPSNYLFRHFNIPYALAPQPQRPVAMTVIRLITHLVLSRTLSGAFSACGITL